MAILMTINFACQDPNRLADFWAAALYYEKEETPVEILHALEASGETADLAAAIRDKEGIGPRIFFERKKTGHTVEASELQVGCGREVPGRFAPIHLDLFAEDREAEVERLVELGASVVEERCQSIGEISESFIVLRDPEGNGFCLH